MAIVTVPSNPYTNGDNLIVNFTTDVTNITDVQLTNDGSNYISATSFSNTAASFDVSSWNSGTYSSCYLKVIYTETSSGGGTSSGGDFSTESGSFGAIIQSASKWYIIGDSISDTGLIPQRKYMTVLGEAFSNVTITNLGKDGSHFSNKTTGYQRFITQLQNHSTTAPSLITIFGGVNDYIQSVPIGDASSSDNTNFYGAVKEFVSALNTKYPTSKKVFILPLNMRNGVFNTNANGTNSLGNTLANYRDTLISVLNSNGMAYIDLHDDSELQPDLITSDGLHPNQDGHALLARKLCAAIVGEATGGGNSGGETTTYTITYNLSNCISSNNNTIINKGDSYTASISPNSDYTMRSITVTIGGTDVTSTVVNNYTINITNVTGNIVITATATQSSSGDTSQDALVYSLPSETTFTGSNYIDTGVRLFTSNTDWTIFIDYQLADTTQANKQLFSCTTKTDTSKKAFGMYMYSQRCMLYGTVVGSAIKINDTTGDTSRRKIAITKSGSNLIINHDTTNSWDVANGYTQQFTYNSATYGSITNSLVLGVDNGNPEAFIDYFIGTIYQCKIYNKALSDSEITTLLGNSTTTNTYTAAVVGDFSTVGNCSGIAIDSSGNLTASTLGQWGMVKLDKTVTKLKFTLRSNQADYGAFCWYIYNNNSDGTYDMIALDNVVGGENGKRFKMTIPGTAATQIDKLDISTINPGETLTIEMSGSTQTIKREDGTTLTTLTGNMSGWCGQSTNSSPFCSNIQYVE